MATTTVSIVALNNEIWSTLPDTSVGEDALVTTGYTAKEDTIWGLFMSEDFSALAGSTINTATLKLYCAGYVGEAGGTWYVYRVRAHGGEPDATPYYYTRTSNYQVSWNSRHNKSGSEIAWTTPGAGDGTDDIDMGATGASEDNPLGDPVADSYFDAEVTGAMQHALDNCGGIIAFRVHCVFTLGEGESAYAELGHGGENAYIDVDYTPPAGGNIKKISGVDWDNVKKVSGIAEASIKKVSGVVANCGLLRPSPPSGWRRSLQGLLVPAH